MIKKKQHKLISINASYLSYLQWTKMNKKYALNTIIPSNLKCCYIIEYIESKSKEKDKRKMLENVHEHEIRGRKV